MFPRTYFAGRYFAPLFFPGGGGEAGEVERPHYALCLHGRDHRRVALSGADYRRVRVEGRRRADEC